jgi:hypothetical protein
MEVSDIVYLDLCCFKRPFDDATQERVRREAETILRRGRMCVLAGKLLEFSAP